MRLGPLFHWSPADRRADIENNGLLPSRDPTINTKRHPYIYFGFDPADAWRLSGDMPGAQSIVTWDLWQVAISPDDVLDIRAEFGADFHEVKLRRAVPRDRMWWVARRKQGDSTLPDWQRSNTPV